MVKDGQTRAANIQYLTNYQATVRQSFNTFDWLDLKKTAFLVYGLYFLIVEDESDIKNAIDRYNKDLQFDLKPTVFKRRDIIFDILRHLRNGYQCVLNFQFVLMAENVLETFRYDWNTRVNQKPLDSTSLPFPFNFEYTQVSDKFKKLSVDEALNVLTNNVADEKDAFVSNFIQDHKFNKHKTIEGGYEVDEKRSVEHQVDESIKQLVNGDILSADTIRQLLQNENSGDQQDDEQRLKAKLKYMLEHVKTFKFEDMQHHHGGRSRAPILCVSGFLS